MFRVIFWREVVDLARDRRTLVSVVLLPLIGLPGLALLSGALASTQTVSVAVVVEDPGALQFAEDLAEALASEIEERGSHARVEVLEGEPGPGYDLVVVIPRGFTANLSRIDGTAVVLVSRSLGQAGDLAQAALESVVASLSWSLVASRVEALAEAAGVPVDVASLLDPIRVVRRFHTVTGAPVGEERAVAAFTARLLEFALFFVVNPAVVYVSDSIVGERERRTLEKLLAAPVGRYQLLAGKIAAGALLGAAAAVVDSLGVLAFFSLAGAPLEATPGLAAAWAAAAGLAILSAAGLAALVAARSPSVRAAQNAAFLVVMAALTVYFAALTVDLSRLPAEVSIALQALPFTHAALIVHLYAVGDPAGAAAHAAILAAYTAGLIYAAARAFNAERLVAAE